MKYFEFKFRKLLSWKLTWGFKSFFRGSGLELEDFRKYEVWDEPRHINWKLSAKHWDLFVKLFKQEKDTQVHVFFDINSNWNSWNDYLYMDRILDFFSDIVIYSKKYGAKVVSYYPKDGKVLSFPVWSSFMKAHYVINDLKKLLPNTKKTYVSYLERFIQLQKRVSKRHVIIIFSDFLWMSSDQIKVLKAFSQKNEIFLLRLNIPNLVWINFDKFSLWNMGVSNLQIYDIDEFK